MKWFIKYLVFLLTFCSLMSLQINGDTEKIYKEPLWELKADIQITGSFKTFGSTNIRGTYIYNGVLKGTIGLDEDKDYIYYYEKGEVNKFELKYFNSKIEKNTLSKKKTSISQEIEFIIRNGRFIYLEFVTENLDISKLDRDINIKLSLPRSYGVLKRKLNRRYRKGIKEGSNKIFWKEKLLYSKLNFKKNYKWTWTKTSGALQQSHSVKVQLYIKIK